jgi:hypothetical protein
MLAEMAHWLVDSMNTDKFTLNFPDHWESRVKDVLQQYNRNWSHMGGRIWLDPLVESHGGTDALNVRALWLAVEASARIGASMMLHTPTQCQVAASVSLYLVYESLVKDVDPRSLEMHWHQVLATAPCFDIQNPRVAADTLYSYVQHCIQHAGMPITWAGVDTLSNVRHSLNDVWFWDTVRVSDVLGPRLALTAIQSVQEILQRHIKAAAKRLRWQQVDQVIIEGPSALLNHQSEVRYLIAAYVVHHDWSDEIYDSVWIQDNIEALRAVMGRVEFRKTCEMTSQRWTTLLRDVPNLFTGITQNQMTQATGLEFSRWPLQSAAERELHLAMREASSKGPLFAPDAFTNIQENIPVHVRLMTTRGGAWPERRTLVQWSAPHTEI